MRLGRRKPAPGQQDLFAEPVAVRPKCHCVCPECKFGWKQYAPAQMADGKYRFKCINCNHFFSLDVPDMV